MFEPYALYDKVRSDGLYAYPLLVLWLVLCVLPLGLVAFGQTLDYWLARNGLGFAGITLTLMLLSSRWYYASYNHRAYSVEDFFERWSATLIFFCGLMTPTWIILLAKFALNPDGFWQNAIVFGLGYWLLGGAQIIALIIGLVLIGGIWNEIPPPKSEMVEVKAVEVT